ncbi:MAG: ATP synthase F1 subunit gamma [Defluviitaleaceae bacterium]|nr:ATP synthase F1 subunit gamma [Defluviitaleaceae bacterium]
MPSMKAIKRRRLTVKNISQITKAMNLVATSKLQRARAALAAVGKPVQATFDMVYNTVSDVDPFAMEENFDRPFIVPHVDGTTAENPQKTAAYVLITSNRGLCGGYNSAVCKELVKHAKANNIKPIIVPLGTKGRDYFKRRNANLFEVPMPAESPTFADAKVVADSLVSMYETRNEDKTWKIDEIYLVYTQFRTVLNLEPIIRKVLPIDPAYLRRVVGTDLHDGEAWEDLGFFPRPKAKSASSLQQEIEYEPGLDEVLRAVVPWYLCMFIHAALASSALCEQAARMTSMDSATKNAGDIIEKLTLMFNRQRQSIITQEITEIVSGANALK